MRPDADSDGSANSLRPIDSSAAARAYACARLRPEPPACATVFATPSKALHENRRQISVRAMASARMRQTPSLSSSLSHGPLIAAMFAGERRLSGFHDGILTTASRLSDLSGRHNTRSRLCVRISCIASAVCNKEPSMRLSITHLVSLVAGTCAVAMGEAHAQELRSGISNIDTVVVIYAENRSFDNLYGSFPGANGLQNATPENSTQLDRDGTVLKELPPVWDGLTGKGVTPPVTQAQTEHLPNKPFAIDDPDGFKTSSGVTTHDLWHLFYQNQMQTNGGRNDRFVAYADAGALVMGHYDGSRLPMWNVARKYVLADNFFQGASGGSFLNPLQLVCACTPVYPHADKSPASKLVAALDPDGVSLTLAPNSPKSAMDGIPKFVNNGTISPDFYAVNTMQPPYQPRKNKPAKDGDPRFADPSAATTLPPQHDITIGDLLSLKSVSWSWYAGAWQDALDGGRGEPVPNFQFHHQAFNYFAQFAPGTPARGEHLKDGGINGVEF